MAWEKSLRSIPHFKVLPCAARDLEQAWRYFDRPDLHRLLAVDAVGFVLMDQRRIRLEFASDSHFATGGFRIVG